MKIIKKLPLLFIVLIGFYCSKDSTKTDEIITIEDLLVKNNEISGWNYGGQRWVANNISELTTYINGLAEVYQRYGFVDAANQSYEGKIDNQNRQLQLTVYRLQNEENTRGAYEDPDLGLGSTLQWENGAGTEAKYVRYGGLSQVLAFFRGAYFISLQMNYDTEESLSILKQFALNVDQKIK
jgi:hypothetical protein